MVEHKPPHISKAALGRGTMSACGAPVVHKLYPLPRAARANVRPCVHERHRVPGVPERVVDVVRHQVTPRLTQEGVLQQPCLGQHAGGDGVVRLCGASLGRLEGMAHMQDRAQQCGHVNGPSEGSGVGGALRALLDLVDGLEEAIDVHSGAAATKKREADRGE